MYQGKRAVLLMAMLLVACLARDPENAKLKKAPDFYE
jgi:hypothetical protein